MPGTLVCGHDIPHLPSDGRERLWHWSFPLSAHTRRDRETGGVSQQVAQQGSASVAHTRQGGVRNYLRSEALGLFAARCSIRFANRPQESHVSQLRGHSKGETVAHTDL